MPDPHDEMESDVDYESRDDAMSRRSALYGLGIVGGTSMFSTLGVARDQSTNQESGEQGASGDQSAAGRFEPVEKLVVEDGQEAEEAGYSVAVDEDTALLGAPGDTNENGENSGATYVFTRRNGEWEPAATGKLLADDGNIDDRFGTAVALEGDTALVGAENAHNKDGVGTGAVYVFAREDGEWTTMPTQKLLPDDEDVADFGDSLAFEGDTALVGARNDGNENGAYAGATYVFTREDGEWTTTPTQTLLAEDGEEGDRFGEWVEFNGSTAYAGARRANSPSDEESGAAYAFTREDGEWTPAEEEKPLPDDVEHTDNLGDFLALEGDTALVGEPDDDNDNGEGAGAAFVYAREDGEWTTEPTQELYATDGEDRDRFGFSVAVGGQTALVGAPDDMTDNGARAGAAYVFSRRGSNDGKGDSCPDDDGPAVRFAGRSIDEEWVDLYLPDGGDIGGYHIDFCYQQEGDWVYQLPEGTSGEPGEVIRISAGTESAQNEDEADVVLEVDAISVVSNASWDKMAIIAPDEETVVATSDSHRHP